MICVFVALLLFATILLPQEKLMFVCEWCKDGYLALDEGPYCSAACEWDHWVQGREDAAQCKGGGLYLTKTEPMLFGSFKGVLKKYTSS